MGTRKDINLIHCPGKDELGSHIKPLCHASGAGTPGEQITHIAEPDDGQTEDEVVIADAEVFPAFDPVFYYPTFSPGVTAFPVVGAEIIRIGRSQGAAVDAEKDPPIDNDLRAFHLFSSLRWEMG